MPRCVGIELWLDMVDASLAMSRAGQKIPALARATTRCDSGRSGLADRSCTRWATKTPSTYMRTMVDMYMPNVMQPACRADGLAVLFARLNFGVGSSG